MVALIKVIFTIESLTELVLGAKSKVVLDSSLKRFIPVIFVSMDAGLGLQFIVYTILASLLLLCTLRAIGFESQILRSEDEICSIVGLAPRSVIL